MGLFDAFKDSYNEEVYKNLSKTAEEKEAEKNMTRAERKAKEKAEFDAYWQAKQDKLNAEIARAEEGKRAMNGLDPFRYCFQCRKKVGIFAEQYVFADELPGRTMLCGDCLRRTNFYFVLEYCAGNGIAEERNYQALIDYVPYRDSILNGPKSNPHTAVFLNDVVITSDFVFNAIYKDVLIKNDDVWAVVIDDPVETVIKDAVYLVYIMTTNPAVPCIRTRFIVNLDYDVQAQISGFANLAVSHFKNLRYSKIMPFANLSETLSRDPKGFSSSGEWVDFLKKTNKLQTLTDVNNFSFTSEVKQQAIDFVTSLGYTVYEYPQERKTTDRDRRAHTARKIFSAVEFSAAAIGVATGSVSLDNAMYEWDLNHRK